MKDVLYEGKVVRKVRKYIGEFNVKYNEHDTYVVFFDDGSQTSVSESVAATLIVELQKLEQKELNKKKINVLGTEYDVKVLEEPDEYMKDNTLQGYCDKTSKIIVVCPYDNDLDDKEKIKDNILRHELIHAFLFECGIDEGMLFHNEECVDFFAMQFPKLVKMFEEANCKG